MSDEEERAKNLMDGVYKTLAEIYSQPPYKSVYADWMSSHTETEES